MAGCGDGVGEELSLDEQLADAIAAEALEALPSTPSVDPAMVTLGQVLFFDKEVSGNRDIACATCHHPNFATGDGLSLSIGTGGDGLGPERTLGADRTLIPRNAPEVFNRGYDTWETMFWDSRVSGDAAGGFTTPAGVNLLDGLDNPLAAQAMFPPTSRDEMRGAIGDLDVAGNANELADIDDMDLVGVWDAITTRLVMIPEYVTLFGDAYPGVDVADLNFSHVANAIAAFEIDAFTFTESPWDRYLRGDLTAMSDAAKRGALLFFGEARCSACHAGTLLTDQAPHNVASPQLGPGKGAAAPDDFGRFGVTMDPADQYGFRTPPLRNATLTGPWFHAGAYTTLEGAVRHYLNAADAARNYDVSQLAADFVDTYFDDADAIEARLANLDPELAEPIELDDAQVADLMAFMEALTDPAARDLSAAIPASVPSGLPVDR